MEYLTSKNLGLDSPILRGEKAFLAITASNMVAAGLWEDGLAFVKAAYEVRDGFGKQEMDVLRGIDVWDLWALLIDCQRHIDTSG